jgi:hypothetical protein
MAKLSEAMKHLSLKADVTLLETRLREANDLLRQAEEDRDLLAQHMVKGEAFLDWLIEQDVSSAHMRKPWRQRDAEVEGKSDLELALAYCNRPNAG